MSPPEESGVGELIAFSNHVIAPVEPGNKASKSYAKISDQFFVNPEGIATFQNIPFMTTKGPVTSTLKGKIS